MSQSITIGERTLEITDETSRVVVADALQEAGRDAEADLLRKTGTAVCVTSAGRVVPEADAAAADRHGRIARPGGHLSWTQYVGRRQGTLSVRVGDVVRKAKEDGGMHLVVRTVAPSYVSDDHIEDMDAWASYKDGPGYYGYYDTIPVEETDAERKDREAKEAAAEKRQAEADEKKAAEAARLAANEAVFAGARQVYDLPGAATLKWTVVQDTTIGDKWGWGTRISVATLADGSVVEYSQWWGVDDYRASYRIPPAAEAAVAKLAEVATEQATRAKKADEARDAAKAALKAGGVMESARELAAKDDGAKALRERYVETGDVLALNDYRTLLERIGPAIAAERQTAYDAAAGEWLPRITAEIGEAEAKEIASDVARYVREFSHVTDFAAEFEEKFADRQKELAGEARKAKEKADRAAARKADPMVTVVGNTYPHRDALGKIPGSKLSKLKGGWTWKVPKSQVGKLPRGLKWEE